MCTRCRRDKKVPKVWSGENNMDPMAVPEILSDMSDAEQMLIARLAPTMHVHLLKHGGIASRGIALHSHRLCKNRQLFFHDYRQRWISYA